MERFSCAHEIGRPRTEGGKERGEVEVGKLFGRYLAVAAADRSELAEPDPAGVVPACAQQVFQPDGDCNKEAGGPDSSARCGWKERARPHGAKTPPSDSEMGMLTPVFRSRRDSS